MDGKKTYTGLVVILIGLASRALGLSETILDAEIAIVADYLVQLAGLAFAWYGRYKARPKVA